MGKRAREKKFSKIELAQQQRQQIQLRKKERLSPTLTLVRKFIVTLAATVVLLWLGVFILQRIDRFLTSLIGRGS